VLALHDVDDPRDTTPPRSLAAFFKVASQQADRVENTALALFDRIVNSPAGPGNGKWNIDLSHEVDKPNKIWRLKVGRAHRIYYFKDDSNRTIVCTHCSKKSSGKVDKADVKKAVLAKARYEELLTVETHDNPAPNRRTH